MGLFSKADKELTEKCIAFIDEMHDELNEMLGKMIDEEYNFEPDAVSYPMIYIVTEAAGTNSHFPPMKKLLNNIIFKISRSSSRMLHSTNQQVRKMFRDAVVYGVMSQGEFQLDDMDRLDFSQSMERLAFVGTDLMYSSLVDTFELAEDKIEGIKEKFTAFSWELGDYLTDKYDKLFSMMEL